MIRRTALALAACLAAAPAWAVETAQSDKTFEGLLGEGYRIVATGPQSGLIIPLLFLAKDGAPSVYLCIQQFRNCQRLIDSLTNSPQMPGGAPFPALPPH